MLAADYACTVAHSLLTLEPFTDFFLQLSDITTSGLACCFENNNYPEEARDCEIPFFLIRYRYLLTSWISDSATPLPSDLLPAWLH